MLGPIVVYYSPQVQSPPPVTPQPATPRIEAHILSCAGFHSYPKLALAPSSPLYAAVNHLPPQTQTSDLRRGLAVAVFKYFSELPKSVKETILRSKSNAAPAGEQQAVAFDEMHAGDLAARLKELESETLAHDLMWAYSERFVTALDVDIVLRSEQEIASESVPEEAERFLNGLGEPTYLPFTKLKRSASKPASAALRPKSSRDATEALGRELEELRHTEENYVAKLRELLEDIVKPLKRHPPPSSLSSSSSSSSSSRKAEWGSLSPKDLDALFPPCLEKIIEVNTRFLEGIKAGGISEVSKCCRDVFPQFKKPYEEYLQASADFPQLLSKCTKNRDSSFSKKIQQTGEQKLRSLIIEPVQRLPRYSLLIDNMINLLPPEHPSLEILNDARGTIAEICSLQSSETSERTVTVKRLQNIIASWPLSLQPTGRLITAIDYLEILPPYNDSTSEAIQSILLLFPDCLVILRRPSTKSLLARAVVAEVDRPGGGVSTNSGSGNRRDGGGNDLQFIGWVDIADVKLAGSDVGAVLWMTSASSLRDSWDIRGSGPCLRKMRLLNQYEGRAHKVEEEFAKARIERRAGQKSKGVIGIREAKYEGLSLWSCVWGSQAQYAAEKRKASTVVYLDMGSNSSTTGRSLLIENVGKDGVDAVFSLEESKGKQLRLECRSWSDYSSVDTLSYQELLPVFTMRLSSLLRMHSSIQHPPLTSVLISANRKLIRSLGVPFEGESRFSKLRPPSPVKLISSILNTPNSPSKTRANLLERSQSQMLPPKERPLSMFQRGTTTLGPSEGRESEEGGNRHRITMASESPLKKLEDTFEAFTSALRIIGNSGVDLRPLHKLHKVDSDAIELLRSRLGGGEESIGNRLGQDIGIDVVLVAFAKFLRCEWKDGMGPVISEAALEELQHKSESLYPGDFEDFFRIFVLDWTPQNKRAFRSIIMLLKELQEKVEAEDDKGMLTKLFTELIVGADFNALDYMGLVDLLVADMESLFSGSFSSSPICIQFPDIVAPTEAPLPQQLENGSPKRAKSVNNGPAAPSLRQRLGLTHTSSMRETKPHSMWRTLSKRDKEGAKTRLERSKSIDHGAPPQDLPKPFLRDHPMSRDRPASRDRPDSRDRPSSRDHAAVLGIGGASANRSSSSLPPNGPVTPTKSAAAAAAVAAAATSTAGNPVLASPIDLQQPKDPTSSLSGARRKRRSSLSDLTSHPEYRPIGAPRINPPLRSQSDAVVEQVEPARKPSPSPNLLHGGLNPNDKGAELQSSLSRRRFPSRKSFGATTAVPVPQKLKMQSPQKVFPNLPSQSIIILLLIRITSFASVSTTRNRRLEP